MRLVKCEPNEKVLVPCAGKRHYELVNPKPSTRMVPLARMYMDVEGSAFQSYFCETCARADYPELLG